MSLKFGELCTAKIQLYFEIPSMNRNIFFRLGLLYQIASSALWTLIYFCILFFVIKANHFGSTILAVSWHYDVDNDNGYHHDSGNSENKDNFK